MEKIILFLFHYVHKQYKMGLELHKNLKIFIFYKKEIYFIWIFSITFDNLIVSYLN